MKVMKESGRFEERKQPASDVTHPGHTPSFSPPVKGIDDRSDANYVGQLLAWEIGNKYSYDLQFNIQYIVDALNLAFARHQTEEIIGSSLHHSNMSIWTKSMKFTIDLKEGVIDKTDFIEAMCELVEVGDLKGDY